MFLTPQRDKRLIAGIIVLSITATMYGYQRAGWRARLSTIAHNVSGTVIIEDANTLRIEDFHYDGRGPAVYFYLGANDSKEAYIEGLGLEPLLTGTSYSGDELLIDLPEGTTLDGYTAISVWCVDFAVNFGSGTFGAEVQYEVTFDATWSDETHSPFPPSPHFSGLIGATHNADLRFWENGGLASRGIEVMAETGGKSSLQQEISTAMSEGSAYSLISGGGIGRSPGTVTKTFTINSSHPLVSLVTMIAPSPDWFLGVDSLPLFQNGRWRGEVVVDLYPYDSGTDNGPNFTSSNSDTNPAEPIRLIDGFPFQDAPPLGTFTFKLICEDPPTGDLNGDCRVDYLDLRILSEHWMMDHNLQPPSPTNKKR